MISTQALSQSVTETSSEICQQCLSHTIIRYTTGLVCKRCLGKSLRGKADKFLRLNKTVKRLRDEKRRESIRNQRLAKEIKELEKIIKALTL